jgi:hypothetical protein
MVHDPLKKSHAKFDAKVKSSKGQPPLIKIKTLKEAVDIWKGI